MFNFNEILTGNSTQHNHVLPEAPVHQKESSDDAYIPEIISQTKRVNLMQYAIEQCMGLKGNVIGLRNLLNDIRNGRIIDEKDNPASQENRKAAIRNQITEKEKEIETTKGDIKSIESIAIPHLKNEIEILKKEQSKIENEKLDPSATEKLDLFNKKVATTIFFLALLFTSCFYISSVYMGMVRNIITDTQNTADTGTVFNAVFSKDAFTNLNFHWLAPILPLMFAYVLDQLLEDADAKKRIRNVIGLGTIILIMDAIIAFKIESSNFEIKVMAGLAVQGTNDWYFSPDFYIVLIMGFVASILLGIIFKKYKDQIAKSDPRAVRVKQIKDLEAQIKDIQQAKHLKEQEIIALNVSIEKVQIEIKNLKEKLNNYIISTAQLASNITKFFNGWLHALAVLEDRERLINEANTELEAFKLQFLPENTLQIAPVLN